MIYSTLAEVKGRTNLLVIDKLGVMAKLKKPCFTCGRKRWYH
jgi:hypothetical protein